jgi:hypothetical protein
MKTTRYCCQILIKLEYFRQIFENHANIKFQENPSRGSRTVPCGRTDMTTQIVALCNFANAPENDAYRCSMYRSSDGEGTFVIWWKRRRLKKGVPRRQYWVHPYFNKSGEFGCCKETRPGHCNMWIILQDDTEKVLNFVLSWVTRIFPIIQNGVFPDKLRKFDVCFHTRVCKTSNAF